MQELLSGKRRLEGFREPWREKRLGNCAEVKNGYAFKSSTYSDCGIFKIVTIANVQNGYLATDEFNTVLEKPGDLQSHQDLKKGDILISMTGNVGRVCRVSLNNCLLNQRVGVFKIFGEIDVNFLFIALNTPMFEKEMIGKGHGAAQPNIGKKDIEDYVFLLPSDISEQCAIASVLTAMDDELAALEAKKAKYVALKQGMMQQLLTGKIRLTEETVE